MIWNCRWFAAMAHYVGFGHWVKRLGMSQGACIVCSEHCRTSPEQKLSEMNLRDSEERFRATFEQAAIGIMHVSFEGQILRCNTRFAQFLGYSPGELVGKN